MPNAEVIFKSITFWHIRLFVLEKRLMLGKWVCKSKTQCLRINNALTCGISPNTLYPYTHKQSAFIIIIMGNWSSLESMKMHQHIYIYIRLQSVRFVVVDFQFGVRACVCAYVLLKSFIFTSQHKQWSFVCCSLALCVLARLFAACVQQQQQQLCEYAWV